MQNPRFKQRCLNLLIMITTLGILLGLSELALRIIMPKTPAPAKIVKGSWAIIPERTWIEYDPDLGWFHKKNQSTFLEKNGLTLPLHTNSEGMRGTKNYSRDRIPGKKRIAVFGDSFSFGFGVLDQETYAVQMETLDSDLEVLNFGVPGFGTDQITLSAEKFIPLYKPDLAILALYPEDFWRALRAFNDGGYGKPYFSLSSQGLVLHHHPVPEGKNFAVDQFPQVIEKRGWDRYGDASYLYRYAKKARTRLLKIIGAEDPDTADEWLLGRAILERAVENIRRSGVEPVIVLIPPHRWIQGTDEPIRASLLRFGSRLKVPVIDLTPIFKEAVSQSSIDHYYIKEDQHWTSDGHRLAAHFILDQLKRQTRSL